MREQLLEELQENQVQLQAIEGRGGEKRGGERGGEGGQQENLGRGGGWSGVGERGSEGLRV